MKLDAIRSVLDCAAAEGRRLLFWWRDDDAVAASPQLDRLFAVARGVRAPVALAAIPAAMEPSLADRVRDEPGSRLLVHGLAHRNHAPDGRKPAEFGDERPLPALVRDAEDGLGMARRAGGELVLPVFVPPWNRLSPELPEALAGTGYAGLSAFGPARPARGLAVVNTHLDPVDWRGSRSAVEPARLAAALEKAGPGPIGLLTHHLMFDAPLWALTAALAELLAEHPAAGFPPLSDLWTSKGVIELRSSDDLT